MSRYGVRPRVWSLESVVAEIQALHANGELGSLHELELGGHSDLVGAAKRYAGTWKKALRLAGIGHTPRRAWTKDAVLREIRRLHNAGKSTAATQVPNALVIAATRRFGTWRKARAAALPSEEPPYAQWTRKALLEEIAKLHARGISLSVSEVKRRGHARLISAGVRMFGTWSNACRRAVPGIKPIQKRWSRPRVLSAIRGRYRAGQSLTATSVVRTDLALHAAAIRYFRSWPVARKAAGVPFHDPRNTWTPDRVIAALRKLSQNGERPPVAKVSGALYAVAVARFGSYDKACRRAGLLAHPNRPGLAQAVDDFERRYITRALRECEGNIQRAAEVLRMQRQSLQRKIRRLGISVASEV